MANKKIKRMAAGLILMACCAGLFSVPALAETGDGGRVAAETAQAESTADTETGAEVNSGDVGTADAASTESGSTEKKNENALTPDGNMNLVDDIGETTGEGKQFITVQSKSGQTFYIIIDRDQNGNSSVYFLNQVDEADLLSLMDDEEVKKYAQEQEEKTAASETVDSSADPVVSESGEISAENESSASAETKPEATDWRADLYSRLPALGIVAVVLIGIIVFFVKMKGKGGNRDGNIDPDRDYQDGYEWDEEEDDDDDGIIDFDEEPDNEEEDEEEESEPEPDPFDQKYKYQVYDLQGESEDE